MPAAEDSMFDERTIYRLFELSIIGKGIFAVLDILAATFLYIFGSGAITNMIALAAQGELLEDPDDLLAQFFLQTTSHLSSDMTTFAIVYLLVHGTINAIFVIGLLKEKHWAYIFALCAMSLFMIYQIYRLSLMFSPWLFALTIFDIGVIYLVWHEYRHKYGTRQHA